MANRDPYVRTREAPRTRHLPMTCDCGRVFIEKTEPDWPGLCPVCSSAADLELTGRHY
ncbi:hypothetical protein [Streptomyces sp. NPDC001781]